jgi:hypothetical protein
VVTGIDYDRRLAVVVVRTKRKTNYEEAEESADLRLCPGAVFGDLMSA